MHIERDRVVSIHYTLRDETGEVIDSSKGRDPLDYIHGSGQIISGLESALEGKSAGDDVSVVVEPEDGYGTRDDTLLYEVSREQFQAGEDIQVGMQFRVGTDKGTLVMSVAEISDDNITLDGNHPLAGMRLAFDVKVVNVRDATAEELAACSHSGGCAC
ncbi:MAG: peptidylprolyl isomerase [bacterium]|nr:MAG: peptidylprolyl isomerase [bacterium]